MNMKSKNLIVLSLLATLLLSSYFVSFVAAEDHEQPNLIAPLDEPIPDASNDTVTSDDEVILYTTQDGNRTIAANDTQVPVAEDASQAAEGNLIATLNSKSTDNTLLIAAVAAVIAVGVGGALGVFFYRKQTVKA